MTYTKSIANLKQQLSLSATEDQIQHHTDLVNQGLSPC